MRVRAEVLWAALPVTALLLCLILARAFINYPFNDDWAYSHVALKLAETGHFHYNGWGSPTIVFQTLWGAMISRLFGFSFTNLRLATLPFSMGSVALVYLLGRCVGLRTEFASFAALCHALSPLFLPLAASVMTDPFACFFTLLCIYATIRGATGSETGNALLWLGVLLLSGICGGSDRQNVWMAPLVFIPYLGWARRSDRRFIISTAAAYLLLLCSLLLITKTFGQKYGPLETTPRHFLLLAYLQGTSAFHMILGLLLSCLLMCLPALLCFAPRWRTIGWKQMVGLSLLCLLFFDYLRSGLGEWGIVPFVGNILTIYGVLRPWDEGLGFRPVLLHLGTRYALTFSLLLTTSAAVWIVRSRLTPFRWSLLPHWEAVFALYVVTYVPLILPGALAFLAFDRYLLPLLPLMLISVLFAAQHFISRIPLISHLCVAIFAAYGTICLHDYNVALEARYKAADRAAESGISPLLISAGFERDGWEQLQKTGHLTPPMPGDKLVRAYDKFWFWYFTTAIDPQYAVVSLDRNRVPSDSILSVPFIAWTPPFHRAMSVMRTNRIPHDWDY